MSDCLFCKIASGEIPAKIEYQDDLAVAFHDINPQSPIHIIIIPRKHIPTVADITKDDYDVMGYLYSVASKIAEKEKIIEDGFRLVINYGKSAGQEIQHIHIHMLGGRSFGWPPG
ncbi:TPA: histidine triad nucleotide-binding protein [Candidatus Poribacteria bacterium]|nr:histidine triad nucleotide-binding protein [Candidatus Poribacteria bacterium]